MVSHRLMAERSGGRKVITMRDVAKLAEVSISTVANVVNDRTSRMDQQILERVRAAIVELDYHPNHMARSFKTGSTPLIGLLVPSISNPVYGILAREIEAVANERHGLRILIGNSYRDKDQEREFLRDLMGHGVKGVIVVSPLLEQEHYRDYISRGLAVVSYDRRSTPEIDLNVDYISVDNFEAANLATSHLIDNGHRNLAYLTPSLRTVARSDKIRGFLDASSQSGLVSNAEVISGQISSYDEDAKMVQLGSNFATRISMMSTRPTGIVAMNDLLAIGLISGFKSLAISVPEDISVVGMDDLFLSEVIHPGITTVRSPFSAMAETMVDRIVQRLRSEITTSSEFSFKPTLVLRNSVRFLPTTA
jgi:DNA-binding LacI/PurR family transcriptional regulator